MNGWNVLVAFVGGFVIAQFSKLTVALVTGQERPLRYLTSSGGMPSGHAASMVAVTTYLGLGAGFDTEIFALALAVTAIIIYDATHVRYAVGEQGKRLNKLLAREKQAGLDVIEGHTVPQVIVGGILGILIGGLAFLCLGT